MQSLCNPIVGSYNTSSGGSAYLVQMPTDPPLQVPFKVQSQFQLFKDIQTTPLLLPSAVPCDESHVGQVALCPVLQCALL